MKEEPLSKVHERRAQAGFTLIELMVSLVVTTIGIFAVIHLQVVAVRGNSYARERTEAYEILLAVEEEMRQQALAWVDYKAGIDPAFTTIFPNLQLSATPPQGTDILPAALQSLTSFNGNTIATGPAPNAANLINIYGRGPSTDSDLFGARAIYRIHYVAHLVRLEESDPLPSQDLVRVSLFVSWDSKDHGDQSGSWSGAWYTPASFFDRHMVSAVFYLNRTKHW